VSGTKEIIVISDGLIDPAVLAKPEYSVGFNSQRNENAIHSNSLAQ